MSRTLGVTTMVTLLAITFAAAQGEWTFELVSVRRSTSSSDPGVVGTRGIAVLPGGRFEARRQTLAELARVAFGFDPVGVVEAPDSWQWNDRFDITAKANREWTRPAAGARVPSELPDMLSKLLQERFELKARVETRKARVTALRLTRPDGERSPGLRPSTGNCVGQSAEAPEASRPEAPKCLSTLARDRLEASAVTMREVAGLIARLEGLLWEQGSYPVVVDQTGLSGKYDVVLSIPPVPTELTGRGNTDRRSIAISRALDSQLGLKLEPARAAIPTLIIEKARKPRED